MSSYIDNGAQNFEDEEIRCNIFIVDIGESYPKVFSLVRQITKLSPKEVKAIIDSPASIIASGYRDEMFRLRDSFYRIGAKTKMTIIDD